MKFSRKLKSVLALLCVMALLVGVLPVMALAEEVAAESANTVTKYTYSDAAGVASNTYARGKWSQVTPADADAKVAAALQKVGDGVEYTFGLSLDSTLPGAPAYNDLNVQAFVPQLGSLGGSLTAGYGVRLSLIISSAGVHQYQLYPRYANSEAEVGSKAIDVPGTSGTSGENNTGLQSKAVQDVTNANLKAKMNGNTGVINITIGMRTHAINGDQVTVEYYVNFDGVYQSSVYTVVNATTSYYKNGTELVSDTAYNALIGGGLVFYSSGIKVGGATPSAAQYSATLRDAATATKLTVYNYADATGVASNTYNRGQWTNFGAPDADAKIAEALQNVGDSVEYTFGLAMNWNVEGSTPYYGDMSIQAFVPSGKTGGSALAGYGVRLALIRSTSPSFQLYPRYANSEAEVGTKEFTPSGTTGWSGAAKTGMQLKDAVTVTNAALKAKMDGNGEVIKITIGMRTHAIDGDKVTVEYYVDMDGVHFTSVYSVLDNPVSYYANADTTAKTSTAYNTIGGGSVAYYSGGVKVGTSSGANATTAQFSATLSDVSEATKVEYNYADATGKVSDSLNRGKWSNFGAEDADEKIAAALKHVGDSVEYTFGLALDWAVEGNTPYYSDLNIQAFVPSGVTGSGALAGYGVRLQLIRSTTFSYQFFPRFANSEAEVGSKDFAPSGTTGWSGAEKSGLQMKEVVTVTNADLKAKMDGNGEVIEITIGMRTHAINGDQVTVEYYVNFDGVHQSSVYVVLNNPTSYYANADATEKTTTAYNTIGGGSVAFYSSGVKIGTSSGANPTVAQFKATLSDLGTHTAAEAVIENVKAPTCSVAGSYEEAVYCADCGAEMSRATYTVGEPTGKHNYVDGTCTICGAEAPHEHSYDAVVTAPTCTEPGYTTYTCSCGDSYKGDDVPATGIHTYDDDQDADCNVCGEVREVAPAGPEKADDLVFLQAPSLSFQDYIGMQVMIYSSLKNNYDEIYVEAVQKDPAEGDIVTRLEGFLYYYDMFLVFDQQILSWSMAEEVTLTLYGVKDGVTYVGQSYTESVETLALAMLEGNANGGNAKLCTVLVDMLNYGAAVQVTFDHNATLLPNTQIADYASFGTAGVPAMDAEVVTEGTGAVTVYQNSISMQSKVELQLLFLQDVSAYTAKAVVNGVEKAVFMDTETMAAYGGTVLRVAVGASQMRETFTIALYDANGATVTTVYTVSVEAYAKTLIGGSQNDVAVTMMRYGDAVAAFAAG